LSDCKGEVLFIAVATRKKVHVKPTVATRRSGDQSWNSLYYVSITLRCAAKNCFCKCGDLSHPHQTTVNTKLLHIF